MAKRPLLSICIPAYNRPEGIKKGIESIISQESFDEEVEVLVIDDTSPTDLTPTVKPYSDKFENVRFSRNKKNLGFERNILKLLKEFQGDYFFFLTDDDTLLPGSLLKIKQMIKENHDVAVFSGSYRLILTRQKKTKVHQVFEKSIKIGKNDLDAIAKLYMDTHAFSRVCLKREFIDTAGFQQHIGTLYPHMYLIGRAALAGGAFYNIEPTVGHLAENIVFWEEYSDYMLRGHIRMIKDLAKVNGNFYRPAMEELVKSIPGTMYQSLLKGFPAFTRFVLEILKIPEIDSRPTVWFKIFGEGIRLIVRRLAS